MGHDVSGLRVVLANSPAADSLPMLPHDRSTMLLRWCFFQVRFFRSMMLLRWCFSSEICQRRSFVAWIAHFIQLRRYVATCFFVHCQERGSNKQHDFHVGRSHH